MKWRQILRDGFEKWDELSLRGAIFALRARGYAPTSPFVACLIAVARAELARR